MVDGARYGVIAFVPLPAHTIGGRQRYIVAFAHGGFVGCYFGIRQIQHRDVNRSRRFAVAITDNLYGIGCIGFRRYCYRGATRSVVLPQISGTARSRQRNRFTTANSRFAGICRNFGYRNRMYRDCAVVRVGAAVQGYLYPEVGVVQQVVERCRACCRTITPFIGCALRRDCQFGGTAGTYFFITRYGNRRFRIDSNRVLCLRRAAGQFIFTGNDKCSRSTQRRRCDGGTFHAVAPSVFVGTIGFDGGRFACTHFAIATEGDHRFRIDSNGKRCRVAHTVAGARRYGVGCCVDRRHSDAVGRRTRTPCITIGTRGYQCYRLAFANFVRSCDYCYGQHIALYLYRFFRRAAIGIGQGNRVVALGRNGDGFGGFAGIPQHSAGADSRQSSAAAFAEGQIARNVNRRFRIDDDGSAQPLRTTIVACNGYPIRAGGLYVGQGQCRAVETVIIPFVCFAARSGEYYRRTLTHRRFAATDRARNRCLVGYDGFGLRSTTALAGYRYGVGAGFVNVNRLCFGAGAPFPRHGIRFDSRQGGVVAFAYFRCSLDDGRRFVVHFYFNIFRCRTTIGIGAGYGVNRCCNRTYRYRWCIAKAVRPSVVLCARGGQCGRFAFADGQLTCHADGRRCVDGYLLGGCIRATIGGTCYRIGSVGSWCNFDALCFFAGTPFVSACAIGRQCYFGIFANLVGRCCNCYGRFGVDNHFVTYWGAWAAVFVSHNRICGAWRRGRNRNGRTRIAIIPTIIVAARSRQGYLFAVAYRCFIGYDGGCRYRIDNNFNIFRFRATIGIGAGYGVFGCYGRIDGNRATRTQTVAPFVSVGARNGQCGAVAVANGGFAHDVEGWFVGHFYRPRFFDRATVCAGNDTVISCGGRRINGTRVSDRVVIFPQNRATRSDQFNRFAGATNGRAGDVGCRNRFDTDGLCGSAFATVGIDHFDSILRLNCRRHRNALRCVVARCPQITLSGAGCQYGAFARADAFAHRRCHRYSRFRVDNNSNRCR